MNRHRYISFFLLITFTVVLAHAMVPHHHYDDAMAFGTSCCDDDHGIAAHSHHAPAHCHAFNMLDLFKATQVNVATPWESQDFFLPGLQAAPDPVAASYFSFAADTETPILAAWPSATPALRAPPVHA